MKTEIILASVLIIFLGIIAVSVQPAFAISPAFIQYGQERQGDFYNISIKVFNSTGYGFWDHGDYVSGASITVHAINQTITGKTDQFGYFAGGFYVPRDQAPGAYNVTASINGQEFKVGQTFVLKFVAQHGTSSSHIVEIPT